MKKTLLSLFATMGAAFSAGAAPQNVVLPLPGGESITFVPVAVTEGENIFSYKAFTMGSSSRFQEPRTNVHVSGTVYQDGQWYLPFCETEITRGQYAAVMGLPAPSEKERNLPMSDMTFTDTQVFISKLNALAAANAEFRKQTAAWNNEKTCSIFFRLPTESEWEFAARGGCSASESAFDSECSYTNEINKYEVLFSGRGDPRPQAVKGRRKPNACGLYDMLGNVSELVSPTYQFEYFNSRTGGVIARGGNYLTEESEARVSYRNEYAPYSPEGVEFSNKAVGFRLVIGSPINHSKMSLAAFSEEWKTYSSGMRVPQYETRAGYTTEVRIEALVSQTGNDKETISRLTSELDEASRKVAETQKIYREELEKATAESNAHVDALMKQIADQQVVISALREKLEDLSKKPEEALALVRESQRRSAEAATLMMDTAAAHMALYLYQKGLMQEIVDDPAIPEEDKTLLREKIRQMEGNITSAEIMFTKGCRLLGDVEEAAALEQCKTHTASLKRHNPLQVATWQAAEKYYFDYRKNQEMLGDMAELQTILRNIKAKQEADADAAEEAERKAKEKQASGKSSKGGKGRK